jgi:hypothetical protein
MKLIDHHRYTAEAGVRHLAVDVLHIHDQAPYAVLVGQVVTAANHFSLNETEHLRRHEACRGPQSRSICDDRTVSAETT